MKKTIENKITMFKTVFSYCEDNMGIISANAGLHNTYLSFVSLFDALLPIAQAQILNRKGVTMNKKDARISLALTVEAASGIIMSHFDSVQDHEIYESVDVTITKLKGMRDMKFIAHTENVIQLLTEHQMILAPYGVNAGYIANLEAQRNIYADKVATPTVANNKRKTATSDLSIDVRKINSFLNDRLDKAMVILKVSEPAIYKTYKNARKTIDNGVRHKPAVGGILKGVVKDEATDTIIADALVQIINTETLIISNELGEFTIINIPPNEYAVKVSAVDHVSKITEHIIIVDKETTTIEVVLSAVV